MENFEWAAAKRKDLAIIILDGKNSTFEIRSTWERQKDG
jgi:hypothetical protein